MSELEELQQDLAEIQQVLSTFKRKENIDYLNTRIKYLENSIKILTPQNVEQPQQKPQQKDLELLQFQGITKYAWDQEGNKVKVFLNLEGIGQLPKEIFLRSLHQIAWISKLKIIKVLTGDFLLRKHLMN